MRRFKDIAIGVVAGALLLPLLVLADRTAPQILTGLFPSATLSINLAAPVLSLPTAPTGGSLGGGTTLYVAVTALDGNGGETGPSSLLGTTTVGSKGLNLSFAVATGTQKVRVYYSTSTPLAMTQYFNATNTSAFDFTATSSPDVYAPAGLPTTNGAYVVQINSSGVSWFNGNGNIGVGTTSPQATFDVASGTIRAYSVSTSTCAAINDGAIFYNAKDQHLYVCEATVWVIIK